MLPGGACLNVDTAVTTLHNSRMSESKSWSNRSCNSEGEELDSRASEGRPGCVLAPLIAQ